MRLHPAFHVAGVAMFVICFVFFISSALKTFLDTSPYMMSKEELEPSNHKYDAREDIPKIIHQVYLGWDNKPMPASWEESRQSCIELNPDFKNMFWDNKTTRNLLETEYPWFLSTYDSYKYPIQRADSIRYFILYHYGGLYIDLDNGCRRYLEPLLQFSAWMPGTSQHIGLTNHIMGTQRKHPYFQMLINSLQAYNHDWLMPYMTVMNSAGPHFVSMVWEDYLKTDSSSSKEVRILEQTEYVGHDWSFFTKEQGGSWHRWDTRVFGWVSHHLIIIAIISLICLCGIVSFFWYLGWKMALFLERRLTEGYAPLPLLPLGKSD